MTLLQAALNGRRTKDEHPAVPVTPEELAEDARRAAEAGASSVHVHPRGPDGRETLAAEACGAAVRAIREACPEVEISLSTGLWIEGDEERRLQAVQRWHDDLPDLVSINVREPGAEELAIVLEGRGVAVEAGISDVADVERLPPACVRVVVEPALDDADAAVTHAGVIERALFRAGVRVPQLHHGYGLATWSVLEWAAGHRFQIRVGLEDTLVLPDGRRAADNAELVAAAARLLP